MSGIFNDFDECLKLSHDAEDLPFWKDVYKKAFPNMIGMHSHRADGYWQRQGIDRSIILDNSKQILIDEKVRGRNKLTGVVYEDIALEFESVDRFSTPGWVCKPLMCDYIAYAITPIGKCYLLPVQQLQQAWKQFGEQWKKAYGVKRAANENYLTLFTPVPSEILYQAISAKLRIEFDKTETEEELKTFECISPEAVKEYNILFKKAAAEAASKRISV